MTEFAFPQDLLSEIKTRWQSIGNQLFQLPEDIVLKRLLETCYHASLRTSEQRSVKCVVAYAPQTDIPQGVLQLTNGTIVMSESELVRLSPVTQQRQTVIGCDSSEGWLRIWGFFEYGHAWVQLSAGDPPAVPMQAIDYPPDCLTITIENPGALTISCGRTSLIRLREGRIIVPQKNIFQSLGNPLGSFFNQLVNDLLASENYQNISFITDEENGQRSLLDIFTTTILAIMERIRLRQHGGSIVIVRMPFDEQLIHTTYTASDSTGLANGIIQYKILEDKLRLISSNDCEEAELQRCRAESALRTASQQLIRGMSQIGLLAAVDGAVLLDQNLRIQGFGVRFPVLLPSGATVIDAVTGREYPCDQWGLRHQSVFSFCNRCTDSIGFIASQDGKVKAVKNSDGQLYFWDGILD